MRYSAFLDIPSNFPKFTDDSYNPLTADGIELGRLLFYDKRLSGNNKLSCASCHKQELAFSDGVALSKIGVAGTQLLRHSPALINLAWANNGLFWDGGSTNLESQAFAPLTSPDEMFQNLIELEAELKAVPEYVKRFEKVFGREIRSADVVKALAQFQRTLISANSKYDRYVRKEPGVYLTDKELIGLTIINEKCRSCHAGELFTDNKYHNNGLDNDFSNTSHEGVYQGRARITYNWADLGKFKTPTLRNVMLTAPFMHDGRFSTIEEVLDHYAHHMKFSPSLSTQFIGANNQTGLKIDDQEKQAIIAFLKTLNDEVFINNQKIANPHK